MLTLSETHIINFGFDDIDELYQLPGYQFIKRNRPSGLGGGICMYVKDTLNWKRCEDLGPDNVKNIWIEIFLKSTKSFLTSTFYRPPDSSNYLSKTFNNEINGSFVKATSESKEVIVLGDFNVNYKKHNEYRELKSIFRSHGLTQLVKDDTRVTKDSATLIDLIFTNNCFMRRYRHSYHILKFTAA